MFSSPDKSEGCRTASSLLDTRPLGLRGSELKHIAYSLFSALCDVHGLKKANFYGVLELGTIFIRGDDPAKCSLSLTRSLSCGTSSLYHRAAENNETALTNSSSTSTPRTTAAVSGPNGFPGCNQPPAIRSTLDDVAAYTQICSVGYCTVGANDGSGNNSAICSNTISSSSGTGTDICAAGRTRSTWYRAPEQLLGLPYGPAADVFSAGCVLSELATGQPLFPSPSATEQLHRISRLLGAENQKELKARVRGASSVESHGSSQASASCTPAAADLATAENGMKLAIAIIAGNVSRSTRSGSASTSASTGHAQPLRQWLLRQLAFCKGPEDDAQFMACAQDCTATEESKLFVDLIESCLQIDPTCRPTADQALQMPYFTCSSTAGRDSSVSLVTAVDGDAVAAGEVGDGNDSAATAADTCTKVVSVGNGGSSSSEPSTDREEAFAPPTPSTSKAMAIATPNPGKFNGTTLENLGLGCEVTTPAPPTLTALHDSGRSRLLPSVQKSSSLAINLQELPPPPPLPSPPAPAAGGAVQGSDTPTTMSCQTVPTPSHTISSAPQTHIWEIQQDSYNSSAQPALRKAMPDTVAALTVSNAGATDGLASSGAATTDLASTSITSPVARALEVNRVCSVGRPRHVHAHGGGGSGGDATITRFVSLRSPGSDLRPRAPWSSSSKDGRGLESALDLPLLLLQNNPLVAARYNLQQNGHATAKQQQQQQQQQRQQQWRRQSPEHRSLPLRMMPHGGFSMQHEIEPEEYDIVVPPGECRTEQNATDGASSCNTTCNSRPVSRRMNRGARPQPFNAYGRGATDAVVNAVMSVGDGGGDTSLNVRRAVNPPPPLLLASDGSPPAAAASLPSGGATAITAVALSSGTLGGLFRDSLSPSGCRTEASFPATVPFNHRQRHASPQQRQQILQLPESSTTIEVNNTHGPVNSLVGGPLEGAPSSQQPPGSDPACSVEIRQQQQQLLLQLRVDAARIGQQQDGGNGVCRMEATGSGPDQYGHAGSLVPPMRTVGGEGSSPHVCQHHQLSHDATTDPRITSLAMTKRCLGVEQFTVRTVAVTALAGGQQGQERSTRRSHSESQVEAFSNDPWISAAYDGAMVTTAAQTKAAAAAASSAVGRPTGRRAHPAVAVVADPMGGMVASADGSEFVEPAVAIVAAALEAEAVAGTRDRGAMMGRVQHRSGRWQGGMVATTGGGGSGRYYTDSGGSGRYYTDSGGSRRPLPRLLNVLQRELIAQQQQHPLYAASGGSGGGGGSTSHPQSYTLSDPDVLQTLSEVCESSGSEIHLPAIMSVTQQSNSIATAVTARRPPLGGGEGDSTTSEGSGGAAANAAAGASMPTPAKVKGITGRARERLRRYFSEDGSATTTATATAGVTVTVSGGGDSTKLPRCSVPGGSGGGGGDGGKAYIGSGINRRQLINTISRAFKVGASLRQRVAPEKKKER